ncbi:hypothetical protein CHS0354_010340 [Potamilus streckersoni]|uniref:Uncharacterized protein n=1 Tax=Potamilus streckersoni TaxID=2493646 RepID=A0AAE0WBG9_9BIVA|nr:hypothetical protein CHS0354_010340 [Potamilus streckersoni]
MFATKQVEKKNQGPSRSESSTKYMHRPPTIEPNYGKSRKSLNGRSNFARVLLHDNSTQVHQLDMRKSHIKLELNRSLRLIDLHKRTFMVWKKRFQKEVEDVKNRQNLILPAISDGRLSMDGRENQEKSDHLESRHEGKNTPPEVPATSENVLNDNESSERTRSPLNELRLPEIYKNQKVVVFQIQDKHGNIETYHTVDANGIFEDFVPRHTLYPRLTDDPRFQRLHNALVPSKTAFEFE